MLYLKVILLTTFVTGDVVEQLVRRCEDVEDCVRQEMCQEFLQLNKGLYNGVSKAAELTQSLRRKVCNRRKRGVCCSKVDYLNNSNFDLQYPPIRLGSSVSSPPKTLLLWVTVYLDSLWWKGVFNPENEANIVVRQANIALGRRTTQILLFHHVLGGTAYCSLRSMSLGG